MQSRGALSSAFWPYFFGGMLFFCLGGSEVEAHKARHPRRVRLLLHHHKLEVYLNLLLAPSPSNRWLLRLFDRNRNHSLEPREQMALGRYVGGRFLQGIQIQFNGQSLRLSLREVALNRGCSQPRLARYCWDYRFQSPTPSLRSGVNKIKVRLRPLFRQEKIPVAMYPWNKDRLHKSPSSHVMPRGQALCLLEAQRPSCLFLLQRPSSSSQPSPAPSSSPASRPARSSFLAPSKVSELAGGLFVAHCLFSRPKQSER